METDPMRLLTPADEPTATYPPPNPDPARELMATLADVDAIFPVGGQDDD